MCVAEGSIWLALRLRALDGLGRHLQGHVVAHEQPAAGQRLVPLEAEVPTVDLGRDLEADALVPPRVAAAAGEITGELDRLGHALERDLARDRHAAIVV